MILCCLWVLQYVTTCFPKARGQVKAVRAVPQAPARYGLSHQALQTKTPHLQSTFTLRGLVRNLLDFPCAHLSPRYMKYLYAYECEKKSLSSPAELQAAIDGNRREGRRPSYSSSLFSYSPTASGPPSLLSPPKIRFPIIGVAPGSGTSNPRVSPAAAVRKGELCERCSSKTGQPGLVVGHPAHGRGLKVDDLRGPFQPRPADEPWCVCFRIYSLFPFLGDGVPLTVSMPNRIAVPVTLASQQATVAARTATLEQLRERLEAGEPPEKKVSRMTEEEQRLVQQALQRNLFNMARQIPMKIKINGKGKMRLWVQLVLARLSSAALCCVLEACSSIAGKYVGQLKWHICVQCPLCTLEHSVVHSGQGLSREMTRGWEAVPCARCSAHQAACFPQPYLYLSLVPPLCCLLIDPRGDSFFSTVGSQGGEMPGF